MKNILNDKRTYGALVGLTTKLHALGVSPKVLKEIHKEVGDLVRVGIEIGTEEIIKKVFSAAKENTTAINSDVKEVIKQGVDKDICFTLNNKKCSTTQTTNKLIIEFQTH